MTTLTTTDSPKTVHEALAAASTGLGAPYDEVLSRLIESAEHARPLGTDGKHGDLHTDECGCVDKPATREAVAAAIEEQIPNIVTALGAHLRGLGFGFPEPMIEHIATAHAALFASVFGSAITDAEIGKGRAEQNDAMTQILEQIFLAATSGAKLDGWLLGAVLSKNGSRSFAMLADRPMDFEHQALAGELSERVTADRRRQGA